MSDTQDKDFLESIVKTIVGHPEDVVVERTVDEMGVLLTLKINPEDMGYVIGRRGQTAQAIRTLLKIVGAKNNARVNLKIYEPEGSVRPPRRRDENQARANDDVDTSVIDDLDSLTI
ncbi:MAG: KH domain-containing protein [Patescibacteria group bacterium]|nr:MAG: KH domain-containing protein [Patescibacteria group bacterium]